MYVVVTLRMLAWTNLYVQQFTLDCVEKDKQYKERPSFLSSQT